MPLINLGLLIGFFIAGYTILTHFFHRKNMKEKLEPMLDKAKSELQTTPSILNQSKLFQKHQIKPITKKAYKASHAVLEQLTEIMGLIQKYGHLPEARKEIKTQLDNILPRQMEIVQNLNRLRAFHKRILAVDWSIYSAQTRNQLGSLDGPSKIILKKELSDEYRKLGIERELQNNEQRIQNYQLELRQNLQQAGILLINGNPHEAINLVQHAIGLEKGALGLLEQLRDLEKQMLSHTKKEIAMGRRAEALAYS
jgi:cell division protein FtsL